ncbi:hypothetical protein BJS_01229 [Bradyrhizobium japonicum SEMIA 5079]|nr:hypothetical protein BJS_01229 [Bradyrhizobium japonicum SEMIA 5079]
MYTQGCFMIALDQREYSLYHNQEMIASSICNRHDKKTQISPPSLRGALATKQSRLPQRKDSGLLRCARNDGMCGST